MKNSSTSRTLVTLNVGDKVDILERQENWYRIRHGDQLQGWMEESTIVTNETVGRIHDMVTASQSQQPQNTAVLKEEANFRIDPGRSTAIIRKLDGGTKVEVLERVTNARPGSDSAFDVWLKARSSPTEVGWLIGSLVDFDIPSEIAQYSEGYTYTAIKTLNQVQDSIAGPINWYIAGEKRPGLDPMLDFDGVRVFTWNMKMHRYETAFRARGLRGVYPLEIGQQKGNPTFRFYELGTDNQTKTPHDYIMYGVVTRLLSEPSPEAPRKQARISSGPKKSSRRKAK
jgi:SH3-like domain-containing protein